MKKIILSIAVLALFMISACETGTFPHPIAPEATDFESCIAAGYPVMESYPRQCNWNGVIVTEEIDEQIVGGDRDEHGCIGSAGYSWCPSTEKCQRMWEEYCEEYKEQYKEPTACTMEYAPVCATVAIQCVTTPCDPVKETYSNACMALASGTNIIDITEGECGSKTSTKHICTEEQKQAEMCTMEYMPVCGFSSEGSSATYGNKCVACGAPSEYWIEGECE